MWQVTAVLGAMLGFLFWLYTGEVEKRVQAEITAVSNQKALEYAKSTAEASQRHVEAIEALKVKQRRTTEALNAKLDQSRDMAAKLALADPKTFGDDYHIKLGRIMCLIQAGPNILDRETCSNAPDSAYISDIAMALTVTAEQAEIWQEFCEDGQKDFCEWSITGFTPNTSITVLQWLYRVDEFARAQGDQIIGFHELIKKITKEDDNGNP